MCEDPTKEDTEWFPEIVGGDWREIIKTAVSDYRDESFIQQFLSPKVIRDLRMMTAQIKGTTGTVTEISDEIGYRNIRNTLSSSYNMINFIPDIVVKSARMSGDRLLTLEYKPYRDRAIYNPYAQKVLSAIKSLWMYNVELVRYNDKNEKIVICTT
jgi:spore cortex formation protein SpoVR/YcgB (stage V sporulation)